MKKLRLFMVAILATLGLAIYGQNLLTGGDMEADVSGSLEGGSRDKLFVLGNCNPGERGTYRVPSDGSLYCSNVY